MAWLSVPNGGLLYFWGVLISLDFLDTNILRVFAPNGAKTKEQRAAAVLQRDTEVRWGWSDWYKAARWNEMGSYSKKEKKKKLLCGVCLSVRDRPKRRTARGEKRFFLKTWRRSKPLFLISLIRACKRQTEMQQMTNFTKGQEYIRLAARCTARAECCPFIYPGFVTHFLIIIKWTWRTQFEVCWWFNILMSPLFGANFQSFVFVSS